MTYDAAGYAMVGPLRAQTTLRLMSIEPPQATPIPRARWA
jgi:hypothetical protein